MQMPAHAAHPTNADQPGSLLPFQTAKTKHAKQQQPTSIPTPLQVDVLLWQPLKALERVQQAMKLAAQPGPSRGPATSVSPQLWLQCRAQVSPCCLMGSVHGPAACECVV